jgi:hypothetical protein
MADRRHSPRGLVATGIRGVAILATSIASPACGPKIQAAGAGETGQATDSSDAGDTGTNLETHDIPCAVADVLAHRCWSCHDDPPSFGAPMPLIRRSDFVAPAVTNSSRAVYDLVGVRIDSDTRPMPPTGELTDDERATLHAWLAEDVPARDAATSCDPSTSPMPPPIGPEALACEVTHTFTAHAGDGQSPFLVPASGADNLYQCFTFQSPLSGTEQGTAWAPIVDDERVLHHWILYRTQTPQPHNGVMPCQMPSDAVFVSGWAPGGGNFVLPEDIGAELGGPNDWFILQIHYHNTAGYDDALDASGVAFCTTDTPRPKLAGIFTLGTVNLQIPPQTQDHEATGTCPGWATGLLPEPVHVIANFPHMHQLGRSLRTEIWRGADPADIEALVDVPQFNFESQLFYETDPPIAVHPGDRLDTTCVYDNNGDQTVRFGERTEDEMCFNFLMVYPVELLGTNRQCGLL